jgi:hypothetical protein
MVAPLAAYINNVKNPATLAYNTNPKEKSSGLKKTWGLFAIAWWVQLPL